MHIKKRNKETMRDCTVLRRIVFFYQLLFACMGTGVVILAASIILANGNGIKPPGPILVSGLVVGVLLTVICAIGAYGSTSHDQNKPIRIGALIIYAVLMGALVSLIFVGGLRVEEFLAKPEKIDIYLDQVWDGLRDSSVAKIQAYGQCCGYLDYDDRVVEPCTHYEPQVGCRDVMIDIFKPKTRNSVTVALVLAICGLFGLFLDTLMLFSVIVAPCIPKKTKKKNIDDDLIFQSDAETGGIKFEGNRQPFDAWHKAVFQS